MWTPLRKDIEHLRRELNIPDQDFYAVDINEWQEIEQKIADRFCIPIDSSTINGLLNHSFKSETYAVQFFYNYPFDQLATLIDNNEIVWLFLDETVNEKTKLWFYEGRINTIALILGESSHLREIYVASKKYEWLICVDHHDYIIATGEEMPGKLRLLVESISQK